MPRKIPVKQITSWSYSRYSTYKQCPLKAKLKFIDKVKEPSSEAMERGLEIHNLAEEYIKGNLRRLPGEFKKFSKLFSELRKKYKKYVINGMVVEDSWAFTKSWDQTVWNDWVGCWVRIKIDCGTLEDDGETIRIRDWKTGKFREEQNEEYMEQLELYNLAALLMLPHVERAVSSLEYVDVGVSYPPQGEELAHTREDIPALKEKWSKRVAPMLKDTSFAPRPNWSCQWCHFRKDNVANGGGQCKF